MIRPYILEETNWQAVKATTYDVAILAWGATEAHNYHMPYGTDNYQMNYVVQSAAQQAWDQGAKVIVLPAIHYGIQTGQLDIPFSMNILPSTQLQILKDICDVLLRSGCHKLVIVNGHGANHFRNIIRELSYHYPALFCCWLNWMEAVPLKEYFEKPGDHADEFETSCLLELRPDLVLPLQVAGDGATKKFKIQALKSGWVWGQRAWTQISKDTGSGNPASATAAKGKTFLAACSNHLGKFLVDLAKAEVNDMYE